MLRDGGGSQRPDTGRGADSKPRIARLLRGSLKPLHSVDTGSFDFAPVGFSRLRAKAAQPRDQVQSRAVVDRGARSMYAVLQVLGHTACH
jgi:hypothetical protein